MKAGFVFTSGYLGLLKLVYKHPATALTKVTRLTAGQSAVTDQIDRLTVKRAIDRVAGVNFQLQTVSPSPTG